MKNLFLYLLFQFFSAFVLVLPDKLRYYLGKAFGKFAYYITPDRRELVFNNLKKAFKDKYSEEELGNMTKEVYYNTGLILVEFILLKKLHKNNLKDFIEIKGEENLRKAYEKNKGVIIYGAHFGNWELMGSAISLLGYPLNAIAQEQENSYFNKKINEIRREKGVKIIPRGISVREVYQSLKKGECVFILGDQDARSRGWKMNFFDRPSSTFPGAVQLASRIGAIIVPTFLVRKGWRKYELTFYPPREVGEKANKEEKKQILQNLVDLTEEIIREYPTQWFWLHRRWKTYKGD